MSNLDHTDYTQRRDEILSELVHDTSIITDDLNKDRFIEEAASQLDQLIEDLIGEDNYTKSEFWELNNAQNQLRYELRNIIKGNQS